jgi:NAD(P)H-quinone oxidoreductase subunit 5
MGLFILLLLVTPALVLIATAVLVPRSAADSAAIPIRSWVTAVSTIQLFVAAAATLIYGSQLALSSGAAPLLFSESWSGVSVYYDGISSLMFLMVSFVGWVICRYSVRYLDGDRSQGNYFRWTGFTLGAVSLMVISGNLILFFLAWLMTSVGLHHLLLHSPERSRAVRAAWTKFTLIRIGDGALALAFLMIYVECGTLQLSELFAAIPALGAERLNLQVAAFLLVVAAAIKSAQFPFHTWLPQTLETPTPVSALMHAGIVNAGGYLIVRTSPIVAVAPWALTVLAIVGAVTACYAATVMLTQTSVKKSLAYSTIAQMGFMMLQCGLGAFSAALLHILAHSMYKAYAFLNSGSVIAEQASGPWTAATSPALGDAGSRSTWAAVAGTLVAGGFTLTSLVLSLAIFGINPAEKPGGLILGAVLCLALTYWMARVVASGDRALWTRSGAIAAGLCLIYAASYSLVDAFASPGLPSLAIPVAQWVAVATIVVGGFGLLLWVESRSGSAAKSDRLAAWYVHASNGFYLESVLRRVFGPLSST